MNFLKPKHESKQPSSQNQPLNHAFNSLQTHFSNILRIPLPHFSIPNPFSSSTTKIPSRFEYVYKKNLALSAAEIKKRLLGIPVYKVSSYEAEVCSVVSDVSDTKFQFYFFSKPDAEDYLQKFGLGTDYQIFDTPLTDERKKAGIHDESFSGVPVFQSDTLRVMVDGCPNHRRPAFFKKADLEKALREVKELDQTNTVRQIQVTALEDIIQEMKDCSTSKWKDVVFIPPGNGKL